MKRIFANGLANDLFNYLNYWNSVKIPRKLKKKMKNSDMFAAMKLVKQGVSEIRVDWFPIHSLSKIYHEG